MRQVKRVISKLVVTMYRDRGIIKWAPFDALIGFHALLADITYRLGKRDKPLLCDDRIEEINRQLIFALQHQKEVVIDYYVDGYFKKVYGVIKRIDSQHHRLWLEPLAKIDLGDIISLTADGYQESV